MDIRTRDCEPVGEWESVRKAIAICNMTDGGTVYIDAGEYQLPETLAVPKNVNLRGVERV